MLPLILECGIGVWVEWSLKYVQICEALLGWLRVSGVQLKFERSCFPSPEKYSLIAHPCLGILLLQVHDFGVDVVVAPWDDERVCELRLGVGS